MKQRANLIVRIVTIAVLIFGMTSGAWGAGMRIIPSSSRVTPGEDFYFDVVAEGIPTEGLGGVQFRLNLSPSAGTVTGVADIGQAGVNDIAVVSPLVISPATAGHSGIGDFFWGGKGPSGILVMDNEQLFNGSALYTFAHTSGAILPSGNGSVARFAVRIGSGVKAERLDITLSDVMLLDGGPVYPLDYATGTSVQLRCMSKVPSLLGLSLSDAQTAVSVAKLSVGNVYELDNQAGTRPLNVVLEQSITAGSDLLCQSTVNLAVNTPPADPGNVQSVDKPNDESGTVILSWTPSPSTDAAGYRVYSGSVLLKQLAGGGMSGTEIGNLPNFSTTRLTVKAYDTFGNESTGVGIDALPLDDVPPVISISGVIEGTFYRNDVMPQVSVADASQTTRSATLNGVPFTLVPIGNDGAYTLAVTAVDQANNHASKSVSFIVDKTAPTITVANVTDGAYYKTGVTPVITISDTYLKNSSVTLNGQPYLSGTLISDPGSYTLTVSADDMAGNSASQAIHFTIDTTAPVLTVSTLSDGSYTNNEILNVTGTVNDNIAVKELLINGVTVAVNTDGSYSHALALADGKNTIEVKATDLATNVSSDTRTIYLDQKSPLIDITSPADNSKTGKPEIIVTGNVYETSTVEIRLNGVTQPSERDGFAFKAALTPAYGPNTIEIIAIDQATNRGTEKRTVIFDDQKPSLAVTEPGQDIRTNRDVLILKGTAADALTAVSVSIEMDGTTYTPAVTNSSFEQRLVLTEEKSYAIKVTATDEVGNSISVQRNVIYDVTPPALTIDPVVSPTNQQSQVISGTREEGAAVAVSCATAIIGPVEYPTATTWKISLSGLTVGDNAITATATDDAGNPGSVTAHIIYDITPPTGSILINSGAGITASTLVALDLSAADPNGVSRMRLSNDGITWTEPEFFAGQRGWYLLSGDGPKQVFVQYKDAAGNWSIDPIVASILLDTTPPVVSASPAGGIYNAYQMVQLTTNEAATIHYTTDGSLPTVSSAVYSTPLTITVDTTLKSLAIDGAGNQGGRSDSYIIDTIPPVLIVSTLPDGSYTNNAVLNVSGTVTDNVGVKELLINGAPVPFGSDGKFSQVLPLKFGENMVNIKATDLATNPVEVTRTFYLDQKAPLLVIDTPADNSKTGTGLIKVAGSVDETSIVEITMDGVVQPVIRTGNNFLSTVALVPGAKPNTIGVTATDLANNQSSDKRTIYYDDQSPSLAITEPGQDIRTNQRSLTIRGTASDPYGFPVTVDIDIKGQKFSPQLVDGKFEQIVNFATEDTYRVVAIVSNEFGHSSSVPRNIIFDVTPPPLTIDPVISPTVLSSQTIGGKRENGVAVNVTCATATVGVVEYPTDTSWSVALSGMKVGDNIITVQAYDTAGNRSVEYSNIKLLTVESDVTFTVSPNIIWPPNHKMVSVTIGGKLNIPEADVHSVDITFTDKYGKYNYSDLKFGSTVQVEAWRDGTDMNGRSYLVTVVVTRRDGSKTTTNTTVLVPHDMGK